MALGVRKIGADPKFFDYFTRQNPPAATIIVPMAPRTPEASNGRHAAGPVIDWSAQLALHGRWLRTVVRARLGDAGAVDDVMQEVALAAMGRKAPADPDKIAPWLYRVAVLQALLFRRRTGRARSLTRRYARRQGADEGEATAADPLDWLLLQERRQAVRQAMTQLPDRDREILMLKHTEHWSYRQLAEHLGVSVDAVEYRLLRARRRLRELLLELNVSEVSL